LVGAILENEPLGLLLRRYIRGVLRE